jgi:hypothetical protein
MVLGSTVGGTAGPGGAEVGSGPVVGGGVTVVGRTWAVHVIQNVLCFVSAPMDPSAWTVSFTW